ncbi:hypothetical protein Mal15_63250 [Stieleria maiorica]|uniref:Uncharacterized protein n=1 Tax=Stieleria maiorica TaxID=2795974 RepID=A0A5B9MLL9_9BACT|nr:hypothetical protein [Stieleria maiorica]QEG02239.1 hypothetical protein Mal15_63250 [Stieleria maiorica]
MTDSQSWRSRAKALSPRPSADKPTKQAAPTTVNNAQAPTAKPSPEQHAPDGWQSLDAATAMRLLSTQADPRSDVADADPGHPDETQRPRRRRLSGVEWIGIIAVLGLLVATTLMYLRRPQASTPTAEQTADRAARSPSSIAPDPALNEKDHRTSQTQPAPDQRSRTSADTIAKNVLADAGDGSFALEGSDRTPAAKKPRGRRPKSPRKPPQTMDAESAKPTESPRTAPPAPDPSSIIPVQRKPLEHTPEKPMRESVPLPPRSPAFVSFDRVYEVAFEKYQAYAEQKESGASSEEAEVLLGECVTLFQQCLGRPHSESTPEQRFQIASTLAMLYFDAGHLYHAAVYGLFVTRLADAGQPITQAAATLTFAALQEAHQVHYTGADRSGDLDQLSKLCDLIARRGIQHPQLDTMRFATAQLFERDGFHLTAAQNYVKIPQRSPLFAKAQLAAGRQFWAEALRREKDGIKKQHGGIVSCAAKHLRSGIDLADADQALTSPQLAGMLSLAEISLMRGDPQQAIELVDGERGVIRQARKSKMSDAFVTAAQECLFQAYSQAGDLQGIQSSLADLSKRYGASGRDRIASLQTKIAKDYLADLDPDQPVTMEQAKQFDALLETILDPKRKPSVGVMLWAVQAWSELETRANDRQVRSLCQSRSDQLLQIAAESKELSEAEKMTLRLKRIDLAQRSGDAPRALTLLSEILRQSPAAIDLQIKAAEVLLAEAKATGHAERFAEAVGGRGDDTIWGWAKLTNTLARMHFDNDDKTRYLDRLLLAGFHLNESRLLQARATTSPDEQRRLVEDSKLHLRQLIATFAQSSDKWTTKLQTLQGMADAIAR